MKYETQKVGEFKVYGHESTIQSIAKKISEGGLSELVRLVPKMGMKLKFAGWKSVKVIPGARAIIDDNLLMAMLDQLEASLKSEIEIQGRG